MSHAVSNGGGGLFGFLQGYANPLGRFGMGMGGTVISVVAGDAEASTDTARQDKRKGTHTAPAEMGASSAKDGDGGVAQKVKRETRASVMYPVSTLVVVAVIALLLGSLLRSLISPADFVFVGSESGGQDGGGWREIRRLVEVKYVFGGWDLQIAVVRRHVR